MDNDAVEIIGPHPFERDDKGNLRIPRIATLFTVERILWTAWPPYHMGQQQSSSQVYERAPGRRWRATADSR